MAIIWMDENETLIETVKPSGEFGPCGCCNGTGLVRQNCLGCGSPDATYIDTDQVFACVTCLAACGHGA